MNNEQKSVLRWMQKAGQSCPDVPTIPDLETRKLRARLILEEALETINKGLGLLVEAPSACCPSSLTIGKVNFVESLLSCDGKYSADDPDLVELADGISDLQVVNLGTAVACGIDIEPCFDEVMRSNDSKFEWVLSEAAAAQEKGMTVTYHGGIYGPNYLCTACVKDAGGKIMKPSGYSKPNLLPILTTQSQKKAEK